MLEIFNLEIIRKLIMFKWPIVKQRIIIFVMCPFLVYLATMFIYTSYIFEHVIDEVHVYGNYGVAELLLILSIYFFSLEVY